MLLTHGFAASSHMFAAPSPTCRRTTPSITWDIRGHGRSDSPARSRRLLRARRRSTTWLAILDAVGAERAVLVGHSLGGYLSLEFALAHPERVAGSCSSTPGPGFRKDEGRDGWNDDGRALRRDLDERGLDGLPGSAELDRRCPPQRRGAGARRPGRPAPARRARPRGAADDRRADARRRRRARRAVPRRVAVHGGQDPRRPSWPSSTAPGTPRRSPTPTRSTPRCGRSSPDCGASMTPDAVRAERPGVARRRTGTPTSRSASGAGCCSTSGWAAPSWPAEWFGRGLPRWADAIVAEELAAAGAVGAPLGRGHGARRADAARPRLRRAEAAPARREPSPGRTRGASCSASPGAGPTSPG